VKRQKAKYEWMWKRSSEISECEFECMERSKCAWREDNECAILV
jgi:hypothetical protein